jgi:hypothetical protein
VAAELSRPDLFSPEKPSHATIPKNPERDITSLECELLLTSRESPKGGLVLGAIGLVPALGLALAWYYGATNRGVSTRRVVLYLSCAALLMIVSLIVRRVCIDHWGPL